MATIDKLILKIISLEPAIYKKESYRCTLLYENICIEVWALNNFGALASINCCSPESINENTKNVVLNYIKKDIDLNKILLSLDKKTRFKKLKEIDENN